MSNYGADASASLSSCLRHSRWALAGRSSFRGIGRGARGWHCDCAAASGFQCADEAARPFARGPHVCTLLDTGTRQMPVAVLGFPAASMRLHKQADPCLLLRTPSVSHVALQALSVGLQLALRIFRQRRVRVGLSVTWVCCGCGVEGQSVPCRLLPSTDIAPVVVTTLVA